MTAVAGGPKAVVLRSDDNVAVAARPIPRGFVAGARRSNVEVREPIGLGHKVALADIAAGEPVRKYGQIIGFASRAIPAGSQVHVHNLKADLFERDYAFATEHPVAPQPDRVRTFQGYLRPDGRVGTRNYIAVISTVNCSASTSRAIADRFRDGAWRHQFPQYRRRLRHHPQRGLRTAIRGARPPHPRTRARRFRPSPQRGGLRDRGTGLRGRLRAASCRHAEPHFAGSGQWKWAEEPDPSAADAQYPGRRRDHTHRRSGCRRRFIR